MRVLLIILGCLLFSPSYAAKEVNKCVNAAGKKEYTARACEQGYSSSKLNINTGSSTDLEDEKKQIDLRKQKELAKIEEEKKAKIEQQEKQEAVNKEAIAESERNKVLIKENPKLFSPFAIPPYEPDKLSDLVKQYQIRLGEIERMRRTAAEKALATGECERVESSELDPKSTKVLLAFLVNCSSGKTFFYTELDFLKKI
ncbi:hypothetical protein DOJK_02288 [Patescibacteria group bacterium]|nr:hypothetical protein DOJK_02288 [Patescibacteria group bacterium]